MKKITLFRTLLACLFFYWSIILQAQQVTEYSRIIPGTPKVFHNISDLQNYKQINNDSNHKIFILNEANRNSGTLERNNEVTLTINLVGDPTKFTLPNIVNIYNESGFSDYAFGFGPGPLTIDLPKGTYDLAAQFIDGFPWDPALKYHFVIKELVNIQEDTEITIDAGEANNHVTALAHNQAGEILTPGTYDMASESIIGGNAHISFKNVVIFGPTDRSVFDNSFVWGNKATSDAEPIWNYYINSLSDRYNILQNLTASGYDGKSYFSKFNTLEGISESVSREINKEAWLLHRDVFQSSLSGLTEEINNLSFIAVYLWKGYKLGGWSSVFDGSMPEDGVAVYLNNSIDGDLADLLVFPAITDNLAVINPMIGEEGFFIAGNAVVKGNSGDVLYGSGSTYPNWYFLSDNFYRTDERGWKLLPFNHQFTFTASDNPGIIQGNNTPISVIGTVERPAILYKGRFGEMRESDMFNINIVVKQNNEIIFNGGIIEYNELVFPESGDIEVIFSNTNVKVEELTGTNTTVVSYDAEAADNPPTLQMLQLRDTSGKVTDKFEIASEGTIRLAAGDFQYNWESAVYDYVAGNTVDLYYSIYNENDWEALELTEYQEHFFLPAFGNYYEATLQDIVVPEANSWFDLKIVCTDLKGNKQEQVVSPAFKVANTTLSVNKVNALNSLLVYPNPFSNELQIEVPENMTGEISIDISDPTGKLMHSEIRNIGSEKTLLLNNPGLLSGFYLLTINYGQNSISKIVIRK